MVKCGVLFEVRAEFLNIIKASFAISSHAALLILNSLKLSPVVMPPIYLFSKLSIKQSEIQNSALFV
jgi:hypothetical protein